MRQFPYRSIPEFTVFRKLTTATKIQNFLDTIPINFEMRGETYYSPLTVLQKNEAHCLEGAMLAAAIFWYHGERPLLLDFKTNDDDIDHVVTLYRYHNHWGAISKTNHAVLRFRDPVFRSVRELAMSYFNEYFTNKRIKSLVSYSAPYNLLRHGSAWLTAPTHAHAIMNALDQSRHYPVLPASLKEPLRKVDSVEFIGSEEIEWEKPQHPATLSTRVKR